MRCEDLDEEGQAKGLSNLRVPLRIEILVLTIEEWKESQPQTISSIWISISEIKVKNKYNNTDVDELKNGKLLELALSLIIDCMLFLELDTLSEYNTSDYVDSYYNQGCQNDCQIL